MEQPFKKTLIQLDPKNDIVKSASINSRNTNTNYKNFNKKNNSSGVAEPPIKKSNTIRNINQNNNINKPNSKPNNEILNKQNNNNQHNKTKIKIIKNVVINNKSMKNIKSSLKADSINSKNQFLYNNLNNPKINIYKSSKNCIPPAVLEKDNNLKNSRKVNNNLLINKKINYGARNSSTKLFSEISSKNRLYTKNRYRKS